MGPKCPEDREMPTRYLRTHRSRYLPQDVPETIVFSIGYPRRMGLGMGGVSTQIILVEVIAPVIALYTWQVYLLGRTVLLFNDSSTAENMLVRGYSNAAPDLNGGSGGILEPDIRNRGMSLCRESAHGWQSV